MGPDTVILPKKEIKLSIRSPSLPTEAKEIDETPLLELLEVERAHSLPLGCSYAHCFPELHLWLCHNPGQVPLGTTE